MTRTPCRIIFEQKKIDIAREPVEVMVSEFMQKGVSEFCGSGIKVEPGVCLERSGPLCRR